LRQEELSVAELQEVLGLGQSRISTHLALLKQTGLVEPRREGKRTYYSLVADLPQKSRQILEAGWVVLKEVPEATGDKAALNLVLEKRRSASRDYFNRVAGRAALGPISGRSWRK
jgi:ArsR family transcriptional regulator